MKELDDLTWFLTYYMHDHMYTYDRAVAYIFYKVRDMLI